MDMEQKSQVKNTVFSSNLGNNFTIIHNGGISCTIFRSFLKLFNDSAFMVSSFNSFLNTVLWTKFLNTDHV